MAVINVILPNFVISVDRISFYAIYDLRLLVYSQRLLRRNVIYRGAPQLIVKISLVQHYTAISAIAELFISM